MLELLIIDNRIVELQKQIQIEVCCHFVSVESSEYGDTATRQPRRVWCEIVAIKATKWSCVNSTLHGLEAEHFQSHSWFVNCVPLSVTPVGRL